MFFEYAIEPSVIKDLSSARYFLEALGASKGRFLAKLPKTWARAVYEGLACGDYEKKRIEAKLDELLRKRAYSLRVVEEYPRAMTWLDKALAEHRKQDFRAIISADSGFGPPVLRADHVEDTEPLWRVDAGQLVLKDASAIAAAMKALLAASKHLVFIDPFFRPSQPAKTQVLAACCRELAVSATRVDIHAVLGGDKDPTYEHARTEALRVLPGLLRSGVRATLRFWAKNSYGARFHNRYVLTDVGAVQFGDSLEQGRESQYDRVSIVEDATRIQLWDEYVSDSPPFEAAGAPVELVGKKSR